jgi:hypothetical protein
VGSQLPDGALLPSRSNYLHNRGEVWALSSHAPPEPYGWQRASI